MSEERKNIRGDRYDAWLVRELDPLQGILNHLLGDRTDNEAVCHMDVDMQALNNYIRAKNASNPNPQFKYTFFHAVLAALCRTIEARPKLNYFVRNKKYWERKVISFAFIAKKQKVDNAEEGLVIAAYKKDSDSSPIEQMYQSTCRIVSEIRRSDDSKDDTVKIVSMLLKLPGFIFKPIVALIRSLDRHGHLPKSFVKANPYGTTCFISNLGSIKMDASYHHLINFGTNSIFAIVGEKTKQPVFHDDGTFELREVLPLSFTLDERIADGVYYARSLRYLKALLLRPELLDRPANEGIDFESLVLELGV